MTEITTMKPHKWSKEIKAWADGAVIECRRIIDPYSLGWNITNPTWDDEYEYRIKPQPKEPQYLYVLKEQGKYDYWLSSFSASANNVKTIGKIKLEVDDD